MFRGDPFPDDGHGNRVCTMKAIAVINHLPYSSVLSYFHYRHIKPVQYVKNHPVYRLKDFDNIKILKMRIRLLKNIVGRMEHEHVSNIEELKQKIQFLTDASKK